MTIWRKTLRILSVFTCVLFATHLTVVAEDGTVGFNPETSYVIPEQTFDVDLQVNEALTGTHCYMVTVDFDRSLLELLAVAEGPWLKAEGGTFFFWEDTGEDCDIGICLLGSGLYGDGPGVMATMTFRALAITGTTILEFITTDFTDVELEPISVISNDGMVMIADEHQCCVGRVGDANGIGGDEPTIGDVSVMIDAKFITGTCDGILDCLTEADINQSGGVYATCDDISIGDISTLIDYLFITGPSLGLVNCL